MNGCHIMYGRGVYGYIVVIVVMCLCIPAVSWRAGLDAACRGRCQAGGEGAEAEYACGETETRAACDGAGEGAYR